MEVNKEVKIVDESDIIKVSLKNNPIRFIIVKGYIFEVNINFDGDLLQCNECAVWIDYKCTLKVKNAFTWISTICGYIPFLIRTPIHKDSISLKRMTGRISLLVSRYIVHNAEYTNGHY